MYVELDLTLLPPAIELREPDDFTGFKILVKPGDGAGVPVSVLRALAGERAEDAEWQGNLERMLAYAAEHGWIQEDGAIRAHVEWAA